MKKILSALVIALIAVGAAAQDKIYIFPEFTPGHIVMTDDSVDDADFNFDALSQKLLYRKAGRVMEIANLPMVRSLKIGEREFLLHDGLLCEVLRRPGGAVLVNWKFKLEEEGDDAVYGAPKQSIVGSYNEDSAKASYIGAGGEQGAHYVDIWNDDSRNTYFLLVGSDFVTIKKLQDLYKAFPDQKDALKAFARKNHLNMRNASDALRLFDHLFSLLGLDPSVFL